MSLQAKFAVLIALFGLTVLISVAVALWSVPMAYRSMIQPLSEDAGSIRACTQVGERIKHIQETIEAGERTSLEDEFTEIRSLLDGLGSDPLNARRVRVQLPKFDQLERAVAEWGQDEESELNAPTIALFDEVDRWLTGFQTQLLQGADIYQEYGDQFERSIRFVIGLVLAVILLVCVLGISLLRRWVVVPVGELRLATKQIAKGDFAHRLQIDGEDEIAILGREVNQMAGMVQTMQNERVERERLAAVGELVRRLAHNLRNPLAGIRGLAELTRAELDEDSDLLENQERIIRSVDRFEKWLSDLLSATSPMRLEPGTCSARQWMHDILDAQRPAAAVKRIELELDADRAPETVVVDARHLEQAMVVVISNAIQASPQGGTVRIESEPSKRSGWWRITVQDQGPGVPQEVRDRIFNPYFTTKADGNGIGLTVARQILKAHGGSIEVDHDAKGALFIMELPTDASKAGEAAAVASGV